jgi:hypothetical protein
MYIKRECGCWVHFQRNGNPIVFNLCKDHRLDMNVIKANFDAIAEIIKMHEHPSLIGIALGELLGG